ncbi:unnamed protein product, partial [marine sediment metagenome]
MKAEKYTSKNTRKGIALIVSMIFLAIFASLTVAMLTMSSTNVRIADNHRQSSRAFESADSGLEVVRYWLGGMDVDAKDLTTVVDNLNSSLTSANITNFAAVGDSYYDPNYLTIDDSGSAVSLNSQTNQAFSATASMLDADTLQVDVTGTNGTLSRTLRANFNFAVRANTVFDYGVATRGALHMVGQSEISGTDPNVLRIDAGVYIEGIDELDGLSFS